MSFRAFAFVGLTTVSLLAVPAVALELNNTPIDRLHEEYDVVIAGAGTGGVMAAIQAARLGASVLLLEDTDWIGGQMCAAAVTSMDEGYPPRSRLRQRGLYGEFYRRARAYYDAIGQSTDTCAISEDHFATEPRVSRQILHQMLDDTRRAKRADGQPNVLDLALCAEVTKVQREGDTVVGVEISGVAVAAGQHKSVRCRVLIDATEYGDVLPLTGARYRVSNWVSDEPNFGKAPFPVVQANTWTAVIKQYPKGVPQSLLMKEPPGYDVKQWAAMLSPTAKEGTLKPWNWSRFVRYRGMPDSANPRNARNRSDVLVSRTHVNFSDEAFTAGEIEDRNRRFECECDARLRALRILYYIQDVMKVNWAVADDEGYDTPYNQWLNEQVVQRKPELRPFLPSLKYFPVKMYVRESRRVVGLYTLKAADIRRAKGFSPVRFNSAVAIADYPLDLHGSKQIEALELSLDSADDLPKKWVEWGYGPFQIPQECFIPEKIDGLLVAEKNLSQSRLACGATRLQPSTMLTGQAAGAIAALAVCLKTPPRNVPAVQVQQALLAAEDTLSLAEYSDLTHGTALWRAVQMVTAHQLYVPAGKTFDASKAVTPEEWAAVQAALAKEPACAKALGAWGTHRKMNREQLAIQLYQTLLDSAGAKDMGR